MSNLISDPDADRQALDLDHMDRQNYTDQRPYMDHTGSGSTPKLKISVADPDPYVFGSSGSGSISQKNHRFLPFCDFWTF
jgi:hypothetical protein